MTNTDTATAMIALNDAGLDVHSANLEATRARVMDLIETLPIDGTDVREATNVEEFRTAVRLVVRYL